MIIKMIIHSKSTLMIPFKLLGQGTHIPKIIITQQQSYIIQILKASETFFRSTSKVIIFYFFINGEQFRDCLLIFLKVCMNHFFLFRNNFFKKTYIIRNQRIFPQHFTVVFSTHPYSRKYMMSNTSLYSIFPEFQNTFFVFYIVPCISIRTVRASYLTVFSP